MTYGSVLKQSLGLDNFQYVMIQKLLPAPIPMFVITYDSRRPYAYIPPFKLRKLSSSKIRRIKKQGMTYISKEMRYTLPIPIHQYERRIESNSILIIRDLAGEYFKSRKTKPMNESLDDYEIIDYNIL